MAEHGKGGIFGRASKKLSRTKTKVLQKLSKAGKTTDETFDEYVQKMDKQQEVAAKFQKELQNYIRCAKSMMSASKTFYNVLQETYEADWIEQQEIQDNIQSMELMWANYLESLHNDAWEPMVKCMSYFPPLKAKISKRGRKLVDYDNAKHSLEVQQTAKKKEDMKISKAQEELSEAKRIYEEINNDLHSELPEFYNSRITFYADTYRHIFSAENIFHGEITRLSAEVSDITERLGREYESYQYQPQAPLRHTISESQDLPNDNGHSEAGNSGYHSSSLESPPDSPMKSSNNPTRTDSENMNGDAEQSEIAGDKNVYEIVSGPEEKDKPKENSEVVAVKHNESSAENEPEKSADLGASNHQSSEQEVSTPSPTYINVSEAKNNFDMPKVNISPDIPVEEVPDYPPPQPPADTAVGKPTSDLESEPKPKLDSEPDQDPDPIDTELEAPGTHPVVSEPDLNNSEVTLPNNVETASDGEGDGDGDDDEQLYQTPKSNKPLDSLPADVLFLGNDCVQATHPYAGEDVDELTFDSKEIIEVLPFPSPEDQDDGWLFGRKKGGKKGVFPENFTKRL
ncbi:hypothetical protein ScPMuIL_012665 [Solemya velum]